MSMVESQRIASKH